MGADRLCAWCSGAIPARARRDSKYCSTRCRQAAHRFVSATRRVDQVAASRDEPLRLAYGDPPYPGMAQRYYSDHPDYAGEVDHTRLIEQLATFDGWALSTSAAALPEVLASCCAGETRRVRVAAWFRGARPHATAQAAVSSWEPVIYVPARPIRRADPGDGSRVIDSLQYVARARTTDPNRVVGAKPATFCRWLFEILGASPVDEFVDMFPGSGGVLRAWQVWAGGEPSAAAPGDASATSGATRRASTRDGSPAEPSCHARAQCDASLPLQVRRVAQDHGDG